MATFRKVRELLLTSFEDGDMSPFVKHVAINNNSLFFFVATVDSLLAKMVFDFLQQIPAVCKHNK